MRLFCSAVLGCSLAACSTTETPPGAASDAGVDSTDIASDTGAAADAATPTEAGTDAIGDASGDAPIEPAVAPWACKQTPIAALPTTDCGDDHWCWWSPSPTGSDLSSVHVNSASDVWVGTSDGGLVLFDGAGWKRAAVGTSVINGATLRAHPTEGIWQVDGYGAVTRWSGTAWVPTAASLKGVLVPHDAWVGAPDDVWAVGYALANKLAAHWDGMTWTTFAVPTSASLAKVHGNSRSDVWALGEGGEMFHWNGTSWAAVTAPETGLDAVWGSASDQTWFAGTSTTAYRWNGSSFVSVPLPDAAAPIHAIWGNAADDVWFGEGKVGQPLRETNMFHWNGSTMTRFTVPIGGVTAIHGDSKSNVWAVGPRGALAKWNGAAWSVLRSGTRREVTSMWGSASNDVWATGTSPDLKDAAIMHFDGTTWSDFQSLDSTNFSSVWGIAPDDVWVGGAPERLMHWNGKDWTKVAAPGVWVTNLWGAASDDVWGTSGSDLVHWNGKAWSNAALPGASASVVRIAGSTSHDVWALTGARQLFHYDGTAWSLAHTDTTSTGPTDDMCVAGPNDVWVLGFTVSSHWDGVSWASHPAEGIGLAPTRLWGSGPNDVWAGGGDANIHWDGKAWNLAKVGLTTQPTVIWGCAADDIWLAGRDGTLLHRGP